MQHINILQYVYNLFMLFNQYRGEYIYCTCIIVICQI